MNNEEAIKFIEPLTEFEGDEDYIRKAPMVSNIETVEALKTAIKALQNERPQGKWIFHKDFNESCRYGCNQCGNLTNIPSIFCPNCGADMRKGGAEE